MGDIIGFTLDDGTTIAVQAPRPDGSSPVGWSEKLQPSEQTLRAALAPVTAAAAQVLDDFRTVARRPQEVEISFGVALDGTLGGVIASAKAGTHLEVTLRWRAPGTDDQVDRDPGNPGPTHDHPERTLPSAPSRHDTRPRAGVVPARRPRQGLLLASSARPPLAAGSRPTPKPADAGVDGGRLPAGDGTVERLGSRLVLDKLGKPNLSCAGSVFSREAIDERNDD